MGLIQEDYISNAYGPYIANDRAIFHRTLYKFHLIVIEIPWIVGNDFNLIESLEENKGGVIVLGPNVDLFNYMLQQLQCVDLEMVNREFTWNN